MIKIRVPTFSRGRERKERGGAKKIFIVSTCSSEDIRKEKQRFAEGSGVGDIGNKKDLQKFKLFLPVRKSHTQSGVDVRGRWNGRSSNAVREQWFDNHDYW